MSNEVKDKISELDSILFLRYFAIGSPQKEDLSEQKIRQAPKKMHLLYQFSLLHKNVEKDKWKAIFPSIDTIAAWVGCHNSTVDRFLKSPEISHLIDIHRNARRIKGRFVTHTYSIKKNILHCIRFLEKKGFFKGMKKDPIKWRAWFNRRLDVWLIPKLEKGMTLDQILCEKKIVKTLNNLSTENEDKCAAVKVVNEPIRLSSGGFKDQGILRHDAISFEFNQTLGRLEMLGFSYTQRENFAKNNPPKILSEASKMLEKRLARKDLDDIPNPGGYLQFNLNLLRFGRRKNV